MIVYHGSTLAIDAPDVEHSKQYLDFGRAFYVTSYRVQSKKYLQGRMTKQDAIDELRYAKPNDQIAFKTNDAISRCLKFIRANKLSAEDQL